VNPSADPGIDLVLGRVQETVADTVDTYVKPKTAAAVATTFTFPLALMVLVLIFLIAQPKVDRSDPKLRALADGPDALLDFEDEGLL
jgi:hypothetical protein